MENKEAIRIINEKYENILEEVKDDLCFQVRCTSIIEMITKQTINVIKKNLIDEKYTYVSNMYQTDTY